MKLFLYISFLCLSPIVFSQNWTVQVIDNETKQPLSNIKVTVSETGKSKLTDSTGKAVFLPISLSHVTIKINEFGYAHFFENYSAPFSSIIVSLVPNQHAIEDVEIVSIKGGKQSEVVTHIVSKSLSELNTINRSTLMEGIGTMMGVQTASTGVGISKPIIRGLSGSRVVTYLQGIRYENQQWGSDHGMGITDLGINRVEIIKGPASLQFGADALGGVIFLIDEDFASIGVNSVQYKTNYETVNHSLRNQFTAKTASNKMRLSVGAGFNSAADYQLPSGDFVKTSFYQDRYARLHINWGQKRSFNTIRYSFQKSFIGIPGHSHDSIVDQEDLISSTQRRDFRTPRQENTTHVTTYENNTYFKKSSLQTNIGWNYNQLTELEEKITIPAVQFNTHSLPFTLKLKKKFNKANDLIIGTQGMVQFNENTKLAEEKLVPNSTTIDNGFFGIFTKKWNSLTAQLGFRVDARTIQIDEVAFHKNFIGFNSSAGIVYHKKASTTRINYSSGFRAPTAYELTADGLHHGSSRYEIGNLQLKSEFAHQFDFAYEFSNEHLSFIVNPFVNMISNYISLQASDSIIENYVVYDYVQLEQAVISGGEIGFHYHPNFAHFLHLESAYSMLYTATNKGTALDLIPQNRLLTSLKFTFRKINERIKINHLTLEHQAFEATDRFGMNETSSPSYRLLNIGASTSYTWKQQQIEVNIGVKNILNEAFIPHTSQLKNFQLSQPGRSFYIQFIINLNSKR